MSTACKTAGEALREIDIKDIIKSDFVLVSGDVVSNMDLGAALKAHRARRDKDKNALMTMVRPLSGRPASDEHAPMIRSSDDWHYRRQMPDRLESAYIKAE